MTDFLIHEIVRCGTANAYVKNYFSSNGVIVLERIDPFGSIKAGSTIIGDDSGAVMTLPDNFDINDDFDGEQYAFYGFREIWDRVILLDDGKMIAQDEHFTGKPSQDYQTTYIVVMDE